MSLSSPDRFDSLFDVELPRAPYPGLRPFEKDEWPVFFGREKMTDEVINQLIQKHLVVVHGDSGCGKSSLIRAGVLAQLEQEHARSGVSWRTCTMLPRDTPLWGLAQALAELDGRAKDTEHVREIRRRLNLGADAPAALTKMLRQGEDDHICILVDQFEELFAFAKRHGPDEVRLFVDVLVSLQRNPPPGLYAILTMRSEFLGVCARYRGLAEAVNKTQYLLSRMERPALLRAIREPAPLYGGEVTRPLAERLIADAGGEQDQLPLIQHGLMLLWRRKVGADTGPQGLAEAPDEPWRPATGLAEAPAPFLHETGLEQPPASTGPYFYDAIQPYRGDGGPAWRLDLDDYQGAGGLEALLSTHADEVMATAAPERERREIVEHLFRALTDINADGYAVRRPQTLAQLQAVIAADEATLREIVDAFRADGVSFLSPYGAARLKPNRQIDISHEALIRCWQKIADEKTGWLQREFQDGLIWRTLRVQAQKGETLSAAATTDRGAWLERLPSNAWAERYDGGWDDVQQLMDKSRKARDKEVQRQRELDETKSRAAEARAQKAEDARQAAAEIAAKEQELRAAQEEIAAKAVAARRRFRGFATIAGLLALVALLAAGVAGISWQQATRAQADAEMALVQTQIAETRTQEALRDTETALEQARTAEAEAEKTRDEAQLGDSLFRAVQARDALEDDKLPVTAMQLALAGLPDDLTSPDARPWVGETGGALIEALGARRERRVLRGHEGRVLAAGFSPEGDRIVSGASDRTVRVWDATSGEELMVLRGHEGSVLAAGFSPSGDRIVSGAEDSTVRVTWIGRSKEELIATARDRLPRELTEEERRRFYLATE